MDGAGFVLRPLRLYVMNVGNMRTAVSKMATKRLNRLRSNYSADDLIPVRHPTGRPLRKSAIAQGSRRDRA